MRRYLIPMLIVATLLPVVYVASFAPLSWLLRRTGMDRVAFQNVRAEFYGPLDRWKWEGTGPANDLYWQWHGLWED